VNHKELYKLLLNEADVDLEIRARWYIYVRWLFLLAIALPAILSNMVGEGLSSQVRQDIFTAVLAVISNLIIFLFSRLQKTKRFYRLIVILLLAIDILTVTFIIFTKGGTESRSPILYIIPILISSAVFGKRGTYWTAFSAVLIYDALIIGDWANVIHSINAVNPHLRTDTTYMLNTVAFFSSVLFIIAILADFIVRLLRDKEEEIRSAKEALEYAQNIARIGSWSWDIEKSLITWSPQLYKLFGKRPATFKPSLDSYIKMVHPEDRGAVQRTIQQALNRHTAFGYDCRLVLKNNRILWIHAQGEVMTNEGTATHMFGTVRDITEERELDKAKDEFVSIASHELRTPATAVKNFIGLLKEGYAGELTPEQTEYVNYAYESNEKQLGIINNLLHVANTDAGKITLEQKPISLKELVQRAADQILPDILLRGQKIRYTFPRADIVLNVDPNYLEMAVSNLIANASKYTYKDGKITIHLGISKDEVHITIKDNGVGISKKDMPRLFKKFVRIDNPLTANVGGNGLGLYLTNEIVNLHGGHVEVKSVKGKGSSFTIILPGRLHGQDTDSRG
jgi:PAS domain S-box-containing protein